MWLRGWTKIRTQRGRGINKKHKDTRGSIRRRKSKNRQHNCQMKKNIRANNDLQIITQKTKDRATRTPQRTEGELIGSGRVSSSCSKDKQGERTWHLMFIQPTPQPTRSLVFCVIVCKSLFWTFVFCPLCCWFFFDIRILITPLVSSNSSYISQ